MKTDVIGFGFIDSVREALSGADILLFAKSTPILFDNCNNCSGEYRTQRGSERFRFGEKV